ncbi:hypothetical protein GGE09_001882 [Roseobacter sp. N2S]|nr:hypothetical protein [Roseobacter sp. N2S]
MTCSVIFRDGHGTVTECHGTITEKHGVLRGWIGGFLFFVRFW